MTSYSSRAAAEIPNDLWFDILVRVPYVQVSTFRRLSKFHKALIDHPDFLQKHLDLLPHGQTSSESDPPCSSVIVRSYKKDHLVKKFDSLSESDQITLHTLSLPRKGYRCEGCCNGVLLLRSSEGGIMLWNPLTKASRSFPGEAKARIYEQISYFLGYDQTADDLKIMKFVHTFGRPGSYDFYIYSSNRDSWKKITDHQLFRILRQRPLAPIFEEPRDSLIHIGNFGVTAFDFSTEKFRPIFPGPLRVNTRISVLDGGNCLVEYGTTDDPAPAGKDFAMWSALMMKREDKSWPDEITLQINTKRPKFKLLRPLYFTNGGRQLLLLSHQAMYLYHVKERKLETKVSFEKPNSLLFQDYSFAYTPSLRRV